MTLARLAPLVLLLTPLTLHAQKGTAVRKVEIGVGLGRFPGTLAPADKFGGGLAALGDIDGDGVGDLAVGAPGTDDGGLQRGAIHVLLLSELGTVRGATKIGQSSGGLTLNVPNRSRLGARLVPLGDLDRDGVPDMAALAASPARMIVLFLNPDGSVKGHRVTALDDPLFVPATTGLDFNGPLGFGGFEALGDLDRDGSVDLALGAPYDLESGPLWTGAVWILRLQPSGAIGAAHKLNMLHGGFTGTLEPRDLFGYSLACLPDLDGDGNPELGVGAGLADEFFWVLFLDRAQRVKSHHFLVESDYDFRAQELSSLPDLDGDGRRDLAFGLSFRAGSLADDGTLRSVRNLERASPAIDPVSDRADLGFRFADLGDIGHDGMPEVALALPGINEVWILSFATSSTRNGAGVNTQQLAQVAPPQLGQTWYGVLDCTGLTAGLALLMGHARPSSGLFLPAGEVLVGGPSLFQFVTTHPGGPVVFSNPIPRSTSLIDLPVYLQGACQGAPRMRLSNALDLVIER